MDILSALLLAKTVLNMSTGEDAKESLIKTINGLLVERDKTVIEKLHSILIQQYLLTGKGYIQADTIQWIIELIDRDVNKFISSIEVLGRVRWSLALKQRLLKNKHHYVIEEKENIQDRDLEQIVQVIGQ